MASPEHQVSDSAKIHNQQSNTANKPQECLLKDHFHIFLYPTLPVLGLDNPQTSSLHFLHLQEGADHLS